MNLKVLNDRELLSKMRTLVQNERNTLTQILHHLREVERRKLFSDLGYSSLFDYAVRELKYSEGQAGRRIQAMRLLKEMPELEGKIQSGVLSLTTISKAQSYFREITKSSQAAPTLSQKPTGVEVPIKPLATKDKVEILTQLENKSTRETERLLLSLMPSVTLPKEIQRAISVTHTEVRFIMDEDLRLQIENVKALLGPKACNMGTSELIKEMAVITANFLQAKKFGKCHQASFFAQVENIKLNSESFSKGRSNRQRVATPAAESTTQFHSTTHNSAALVASTIGQTKTSSRNTPNTKGVADTRKRIASEKTHSRAISKALKFKVWQRDGGRCRICGGRHNLQFDHVKPYALGGESHFENLRLLCFHCNQRRAIKTFGERVHLL